MDNQQCHTYVTPSLWNEPLRYTYVKCDSKRVKITIHFIFTVINSILY